MIFNKLWFIIFLPFSFLLQGEDSICWTEQVSLKCSDFMAIPDARNPNPALTTYKMSISYHVNQDSISIEVKCYFKKLKSWMKDSCKASLLKHEQGHFNIAEIYTRKLRKMISEHKFDLASLRRDLEYLNKNVSNDCGREHQLYDKETNNSLNVIGQRQWEKQIADDLIKYQAFSNIHIETKLEK